MITMKQFAVGEYSGNQVSGSPRTWQGSEVIFKGIGNRLVIEDGAVIQNASIIFYVNDSTFTVGRKSEFRGTAKIGLGCNVSIGAQTTITSASRFFCSDRTDLTIGDECMLGNNVTLVTHDGHPIFDKKTGTRINKSRSTFIGRHVWLGDESVISKGVVIGEGSVIGRRSLVVGDIPPDSIAVGAPARVIKNGIEWTRDSFNTTSPYVFESIDDVKSSRNWLLKN